MKILPTTIAEIDKLIADEIQESLHLDYKESPALDRNKRREIAKDVSSFANSDGGVLIYGIIEQNNLPSGRDCGVNHTRHSKEWLEQIISSNITPRIDGISILPIPISQDDSIFVLDIPKATAHHIRHQTINITNDLIFNPLRWKIMKLMMFVIGAMQFYHS